MEKKADRERERERERERDRTKERDRQRKTFINEKINVINFPFFFKMTIP